MKPCRLMEPRPLSCAAAGAAVLVALLAAPARGAEREDDGGGWVAWERLSGDWGGARTWLEDRGVELDFGVSLVWQANHKGGIRSVPGGKLTSEWDLELILDTERLGWWPDGEFVVLAEGSKGTGVDERYVGSLIGVNDDEGDYARHHAEVTEYFYEHSFGPALSLRAGMLDGGRDIDTNTFADETGRSFLAADRTPFPDYAPGLQVTVQPTEWLSLALIGLRISANSSAADREVDYVRRTDWFFTAEAGVTLVIPSGEGVPLPGHYRVGAWHDSAHYERLDNERPEQGAQGFYLSFDQMLYIESGQAAEEADEEEEEERDEEDDYEWLQGLGVFARYSYEPDYYGEIEHLWHVGAQYTGLLPTRHRDALGIGFAQARPGAPMRSDLRYRYESACEIYYNLVLGGGAQITFDLMYVRHPGGEHPSSVLPGIRLELDF